MANIENSLREGIVLLFPLRQSVREMQPLKSPDSHYLSAATGWLELGNHLEANAELENIMASLRAHPDVLELRWQIYAKAEGWLECIDIARAIIKTAPKRPFGWVTVHSRSMN